MKLVVFKNAQGGRVAINPDMVTIANRAVHPRHADTSCTAIGIVGRDFSVDVEDDFETVVAKLNGDLK